MQLISPPGVLIPVRQLTGCGSEHCLQPLEKELRVLAMLSGWGISYLASFLSVFLAPAFSGSDQTYSV